jgi:hypothetical protein
LTIGASAICENDNQPNDGQQNDTQHNYIEQINILDNVLSSEWNFEACRSAKFQQNDIQ